MVGCNAAVHGWCNAAVPRWLQCSALYNDWLKCSTSYDAWLGCSAVYALTCKALLELQVLADGDGLDAEALDVSACIRPPVQAWESVRSSVGKTDQESHNSPTRVLSGV